MTQEQGPSTIESSQRIHEVILTDDQIKRFEQRETDGVITLLYTTPEDVLQYCPDGMLAHFVWSDDEKVIIHGKAVAWWLNRCDEIDVIEHGRQPWRYSYAQAYSSHERKGFAIPLDQVELAYPRVLVEE